MNPYRFFLFLFLLSLLTSCSSKAPIMHGGVIEAPKTMEQVYYANYQYTWNATLNELQRFGINLANQNSGQIVTEENIYYSNKGAIRARYKYYYKVQVTELPMSAESYKTSVSVTKFTYKDGGVERDSSVKSDTVEEQVILHRIKTLLEIERKKLERAGK